MSPLAICCNSRKKKENKSN